MTHTLLLQKYSHFLEGVRKQTMYNGGVNSYSREMNTMESTVISVRLEPQYVKHIKRMAHFLSLERDQDLTHSDLIREAILNTYPLPENPNEQEQED